MISGVEAEIDGQPVPFAWTAPTSGSLDPIDLIRLELHDGRMVVIGIGEAKKHFSRLVRRVAAGEEVIITRGGEPIAQLVRIGAPRGRQIGVDVGRFTVPDDFNAPVVGWGIGP
jgi:prevent-host-death family protein